MASTSSSAAPARPLSKLQQEMRDRLAGGRFRQLNELLYTQPSAASFSLMQASPATFEAYHAGFRRQVAAWPTRPLDALIADLAARAARGELAPPARHVVADFGCGEARLAATLRVRAPALDVRSFDLAAPPPGHPNATLVTACDMARVPLADGAAAAAVFCLSLMGTNLWDFLREADRVLRPRSGRLLIAEVRSRFEGAEPQPPQPQRQAFSQPLVQPSGRNPKRRREEATVAGAPAGDDPGAEAGAVEAAAAAAVLARRGAGLDAFVAGVRALGPGYTLERRDETSPMFVILTFRKRGGGEGTVGTKSAQAGSAALRPCLYKRR